MMWILWYVRRGSAKFSTVLSSAIRVSVVLRKRKTIAEWRIGKAAYCNRFLGFAVNFL